MDNWALFPHTYMYDLSTWPVFSFMHLWLWYPTLIVVGYLFFVYLETVKVLPGPNFLKCVGIYVSLSYMYWDVLQAKFEKKIICNKLHKFWRSDGFSQVRKEYLTNHSIVNEFFLTVKTIVWFFCLCSVGLPKWMSAMFADCTQL